MPALKPQYEKFCQYYVITHNAAEAARVSGYTEDFGNRQGDRRLRKPRIMATHRQAALAAAARGPQRLTSGRKTGDSAWTRRRHAVDAW